MVTMSTEISNKGARGEGPGDSSTAQPTIIEIVCLGHVAKGLGGQISQDWSYSVNQFGDTPFHLLLHGLLFHVRETSQVGHEGSGSVGVAPFAAVVILSESATYSH